MPALQLVLHAIAETKRDTDRIEAFAREQHYGKVRNLFKQASIGGAGTLHRSTKNATIIKPTAPSGGYGALSLLEVADRKVKEWSDTCQCTDASLQGAPRPWLERVQRMQKRRHRGSQRRKHQRSGDAFSCGHLPRRR